MHITSLLAGMVWTTVRISTFFQAMVAGLLFQTYTVVAHPSLTDRIDKLLSSDVYNKRVRPGEESNTPTAVTVDVMVNMISSISEINMDFTTDIYFRQRWKDPRLRMSDLNESINLGYSRVESIWYPDIYMPNLKGGHQHALTTPNILLRLYPDGTILYSQRLALSVACSMELQKFPLDQQRCRLDFMSYGHTVKEMTVSWDVSGNVSLNSNIKLPDFVLGGYSLGDCTEKFTTGTYGCVFVELSFERQFGYYLTATYLPTMLIMVLSWVGFWIDYKSTPSRISLGLLTVLAVTTQSSGQLADLPRVSYVKSIDIWMAICMVFVAGALLEFALVNVIARREAKLDHRQLINLHNEKIKKLSTISSQDIGSNEDESNYKKLTFDASRSSLADILASEEVSSRNHRNYALLIDKSSRVIFPLLFVITSLVYGLSVHWNAYP